MINQLIVYTGLMKHYGIFRWHYAILYIYYMKGGGNETDTPNQKCVLAFNRDFRIGLTS